MKYDTGEEVRVGDKVRLWRGNVGRVVCSLDSSSFSEEFPGEEWSYLERGVLVQTAEAGLIHLPEPDPSLDLIGEAVV